MYYRNLNVILKCSKKLLTIKSVKSFLAPSICMMEGTRRALSVISSRNGWTFPKCPTLNACKT